MGWAAEWATTSYNARVSPTGNFEAAWLRRDIRRLLAMFAVLLISGTLGYVWLEGLSLIDALYMTFITITTVGFREVADLSPTGKVFTIGVIIAGVTAGSLAAGILARAVIARHTWFVQRRMQKLIDNLSGHVVLCGYGRLGAIVRRELEAASQDFVIIEQDDHKVHELLEDRTLFIQGNATHEENLIKAGVERAAGVIAAVHSDADNVFIVLSARQLNPSCPIVSRAEDFRTATKLRAVGASSVVTPHSLGGKRLAQALLRPTAVDLADLALGDDSHEVHFEELPLPAPLPKGCRSLAELQLGSHFSLIAVAVRSHDTGRLFFNPRADRPLYPGDLLLVMGELENINHFEEFLRERKAD
ncbi:MAG: potassium channel protein [Planctomycetota bacterium]|nr:MAG: potassium channel protein [Planctomycetota bacterium]